MDSEARPHGPSSPSVRVPSHAHPWLQQEFGIVRLQAGIADVRIGLDDEAGVIEIVRTAARLLIPAVGHFVPQPQTQVEIPPQRDFILYVPSSFP